MPKNQVTDLITDREMTFARNVLSGTMTDRQAAEAAGLDPDTAAYVKSKPCVRAYMLEHRAAMLAQLAQQEAEELRRQSIIREQVLERLWEIARLSPEMTRNSITGQMKALTTIVAIEGLIPDRKGKPSAPLPLPPNIFSVAKFHQQQQEAADLEASLDPAPHQEEPAIPDPPAPAAPDEDNVDHLSETLSDSVPDPTVASTPKGEKPYVQRYGPF